MEYSRQIGPYVVVARCDEAPELYVQALLDYLDTIHRQGGRMDEGTRIQWGWSLLTLKEERAGYLRIFEPDFGANAFEDLRADISTSLIVNFEQSELARRIGAQPQESFFYQKIVMKRDVLHLNRAYLERKDVSDPRDSGWYIGPIVVDHEQPAQPPPVEDLVAIWVYQLLSLRRSLVQFLGLPSGYLVGVNGNRIEMILDPNGNSVWPDH